jgi:hypothetical protein
MQSMTATIPRLDDFFTTAVAVPKKGIRSGPFFNMGAFVLPNHNCPEITALLQKKPPEISLRRPC